MLFCSMMHVASGVFLLGYFCVLQTLKSNAKKVFLQVRRKPVRLCNRNVYVFFRERHLTKHPTVKIA